MFRTAHVVSAAALSLLFCGLRVPAQVAIGSQSGTRLLSATVLATQDDKESKGKDNDSPLPKDQIHNPVLWEKRDNIADLDLFYGQGGEKHAPAPPFTFLQESMHGTNPKFDARDANDKKWRVKLGEESRPEVAASRMLWAVGYFTEDDYLIPKTSVSGLDLKRGKKFFKGEEVTDARFARKPKGEKKIGTWPWKENPFFGTREFNGLRVMMAVLNNWDLKDENNSVFSDVDHDRQVFLVSDIGATFATNNITNSRKKDKGNVDQFADSKFITKVEDGMVSFGTPAPPTGLLLVSGGVLAKDFMKRKGYDWIGDDIPIADARWMGGLLSQLSHKQIADAFRAANFPAVDADKYVMVVENRIQLLKHL